MTSFIQELSANEQRLYSEYEDMNINAVNNLIMQYINRGDNRNDNLYLRILKKIDPNHHFGDFVSNLCNIEEPWYLFVPNANVPLIRNMNINENTRREMIGIIEGRITRIYKLINVFVNNGLTRETVIDFMNEIQNTPAVDRDGLVRILRDCLTEIASKTRSYAVVAKHMYETGRNFTMNRTGGMGGGYRSVRSVRSMRSVRNMRKRKYKRTHRHAHKK